MSLPSRACNRMKGSGSSVRHAGRGSSLPAHSSAVCSSMRKQEYREHSIRSQNSAISAALMPMQAMSIQLSIGILLVIRIIHGK